MIREIRQRQTWNTPIDMNQSQDDSRLLLAKTIAQQAGQLTLEYFQTDRFEVDRKQDGSPLTIADQEAERLLRAEIHKAFPDDAIVGEEFGHTPGKSGFCWVLDPIDGTKSFISGVPLYGTMVGVVQGEEGNRDRRSVIGSVYIPGLDEGIFASIGNGAWHYRGENEPAKARVSSKDRLSDSVFVTSEAEPFLERGAGKEYHQLVESVYFSRTWGDVYGYMLVATGRVEVMVDASLNVWDAAAVQPIIEEAGGRFTDWKGVPSIDSGDALGSNGLIHDDVLRILSGGIGESPSFK